MFVYRQDAPTVQLSLHLNVIDKIDSVTNQQREYQMILFSISWSESELANSFKFFFRSRNSVDLNNFNLLSFNYIVQ